MGGGKGGGKGKGKAKGGKGGVADASDPKPAAWQCRDCPKVWNGKGAVFCGGCGTKKDKCIKVAKPDPKAAKEDDAVAKLRKELAEVKKIVEQKNPPPRQPPPGRKGGGGGGNGGGGADPPKAPPQQPADPNQSIPQPKSASPNEVLVPYVDQQVSLAALNGMLEASKPYLPESHPRIKELREAIEHAHKLRSDNTDPEVLVPQTERNIAAVKRRIEKAQSQIASLRAQRCEIDQSIANQEQLVRNETELLDTFHARLDEAKGRLQTVQASSGVLPNMLDKTTGQPNLREWMRLSYPEAAPVYESSGWEIPIIRAQADHYAQWKAALGSVNAFASYAATRTLEQICPREAEETRKSLQVLVTCAKAASLVVGLAAEACKAYADGGGTTLVPFSADCPLLQQWCQADQTAFAPLSAVPRRSLSAPYFVPEKPGDPIRFITLKGNFDDGHWARARAIIQALDGNVEDADIPRPASTADEIHAAQQYCTAVVENEAEAGKFPKFSQFMAQVREGGVKRVGSDITGLEEDAAAMAKDA